MDGRRLFPVVLGMFLRLAVEIRWFRVSGLGCRDSDYFDLDCDVLEFVCAAVG